MFQTLEGIVRADVRKVEHDAATGRFEEEVVWHDSYKWPNSTFIITGGTLCSRVLVSGRSSQRLRQRMSGEGDFFREMTCVAQGEPQCLAIGLDAESWATTST